MLTDCLVDFALQALAGAVLAVTVVAVLKCLFGVPKSAVYLIDFAVHKGLDEWKFHKDLFIPMSAETGVRNLVQFCSDPNDYICHSCWHGDRA